MSVVNTHITSLYTCDKLSPHAHVMGTALDQAERPLLYPSSPLLIPPHPSSPLLTLPHPSSTLLTPFLLRNSLIYVDREAFENIVYYKNVTTMLSSKPLQGLYPWTR